MRIKKNIFSVAVISCLMLCVLGTSLAYFTATDSVKNTFTVGSVDIDLIESQYHRVNAGKGDVGDVAEPLVGGYLWASNVTLEGTDANTPDKENASWSGKYFSDAQIEADAATYKTGYFAEHAEKMLPGSNVRKNPYIKNTGDNDAYVRLRALVPVSLFYVLDNGASYWTNSALSDGVVSEAVTRYNNAMRDTAGDEDAYNAYIASERAAGKTVTRDGIEYLEFDFTYPDPLAPGALTFWNCWGNIAIDKNAKATDLENVESFDVIFEADAIQAQGFANATAAFAEFDRA